MKNDLIKYSMEQCRKSNRWEQGIMAVLGMMALVQIGLCCNAGSGLVSGDTTATASANVQHSGGVLVAKR